MGKKLYVGNLPYEATNSSLQELFSKAGTVESANVIMDNFSGRSKGFGFVEMATEDEAKKAIEMFNSYELSGRQIVVNEARPKPEGHSRGGFHGEHSSGGGFGGGRGGGGGYRDRDRGRGRSDGGYGENRGRRDRRDSRGDRGGRF